MSELDKQEARTHATRAAKQTRHAARNAGQATKLIVSPAVDELEDAAEAVVETTKRINPGRLAVISSQTGQGFLALSVAIAAATFATNKFRGVYSGRHNVID